MKAPWFPLYTADFLASPDVQLMEVHEVGAYCLLLMHSWQSDTPGYLANDESRIRRAARLTVDSWKECGPLLLSKWPLTEDAQQRYNPRLLKEAKKQVELRELKAEAGRKSAELKAARKAGGNKPPTEPQQNPNTNSTGVENTVTGVGKNANYSQPQPQSSKEDEAPPANKAKTVALAGSDGSDEILWDASPLTKPKGFRVLCERLNFADIDFEHYRKQALVSAEDGNISRTTPQWTSWIRNWFNNQSQPLRKADALDLSTPTPKSSLPKPGEEVPGQLIVVANRQDETMNRMDVANMKKYFPTANVQVQKLR